MKRRLSEFKIPEKANRILNGILVVLLLIVVRIWHLGVVQHEQKLKEAKKPQERIVVQQAERATIRDRYGIPLALNKVQYNAYVSYGPIRELPRTIWEKNEAGKKVKLPYRKNYITELSRFLARELNLDCEKIEDIIYSKAAILGNVPCLIKENIGEEDYFKLKMLEKDWPGIHAEISAKRCYPLGPACGEVVGYLGPISRKEYEAITEEMKLLRDTLQNWEEGETEAEGKSFHSIEEIQERLFELEKKAYSINDFVGKAGIESSYDEALRGAKGKHIYLSDIRGNFLQELPGSEPATSGDGLILSLSSELQQYAERLLAEYDCSVSQRGSAQKLRSLLPESQPWIKGGAIVAMNPKTGALYALASFPRFDPNDFILTGDPDEIATKRIRVHKWLEDEKFLASIWNLQTCLTRERFNHAKGEFEEEKKEMNWETFLTFILPQNSPVRQTIAEKNTLSDALFVQTKIEELVDLFKSEEFEITAAKVIDYLYQGEDVPLGVMITLQERDFFEDRMQMVAEEARKLQQMLAPFFRHICLNYEKLLLVDLYRIVADSTKFSEETKKLAAQMSLSEYRELFGSFYSVRHELKQIIFSLFCENDFKKWREEHFKEFLSEKRKAEKEAKIKYARPYIEYLDREREQQFQQFWKTNEWDLIRAFFGGGGQKNEGLSPYLTSISTLAEEVQAGAYPALHWTKAYRKLKKAEGKYSFAELIACLKTMRSFEELDRPLLGVYKGLRGKLEKHLACSFYPAYGYGFARSQAFRMATTIGSMFKLVPAYEALRQKLEEMTQSGRRGDLNPLVIIDDKQRLSGKEGNWIVGYTADGHVIPMFYKGGRLPRSEHPKVGKVDLVRAIETSSNPYFALLAGEVLEDPEDLAAAANLFGFGEKTEVDLPGEYPGRLPKDLAYNRTGLYAMAIGQHSLCATPLQAAVMLAALANGGEVLKPYVVEKRISQGKEFETEPKTRWKVFLPVQIQHLLLTGLKQVVMGDSGTARLLRHQFSKDFYQKIIGKTSTAESIEKMSLDGTSGSLKLKHIWFGAISYESDDFSNPELVVIVYLRLGEFGKDAAPIAAKIIQKWREIQKVHGEL